MREPDKPYRLTVNGQEVRTWLKWREDRNYAMPFFRWGTVAFPTHLAAFGGSPAFSVDVLLHLADDLRAIHAAMEVTE